MYELKNQADCFYYRGERRNQLPSSGESCCFIILPCVAASYSTVTQLQVDILSILTKGQAQTSASCQLSSYMGAAAVWFLAHDCKYALEQRGDVSAG